MNCYVFLLIMALYVILSEEGCCERSEQMSVWQALWRGLPTSTSFWSLETRLPMAEYGSNVNIREARGKFKVRRRFKKFLLPLLLAYKLKFFTLIPVLISGLVLLTGATGLAGFFFALFAAVMGLRTGTH